jgi:hypothetical protein
MLYRLGLSHTLIVDRRGLRFVNPPSKSKWRWPKFSGVQSKCLNVEAFACVKSASRIVESETSVAMKLLMPRGE